MSSPDVQIKMQTIIGTIQLFVLILGVACVFLTIGQRDQSLTGNTESLTELKNIVQDLVKSQVAGATKDSEHDRVLMDLQTRVNRLETNR